MIITNCIIYSLWFFFFNDTASTEFYTLSLHDALPIFGTVDAAGEGVGVGRAEAAQDRGVEDRKSTRLNSSHVKISYAVFCLKKKKNNSRNNFRKKKKK